MDNKEALDTIGDIKKMMEKSIKFMSLNGLSSICAGVYALAAFAIAYTAFGDNSNGQLNLAINAPYKLEIMFGLAIILIGLCSASALFLSQRKAKKMGQTLKLDPSVRRLLWNFFLPLGVGGLLCLALIQQQHYGLTSSIMLIFYGLAQISASNYTYSNTKYLGYAMLILGLIDCFVTGYAILFWVIGFGLFHIIYGIVFYFKYDRKKTA